MLKTQLDRPIRALASARKRSLPAPVSELLTSHLKLFQSHEAIRE
jgi:hypothetical protein